MRDKFIAAKRLEMESKRFSSDENKKRVDLVEQLDVGVQKVIRNVLRKKMPERTICEAIQETISLFILWREKLFFSKPGKLLSSNCLKELLLSAQ